MKYVALAVFWAVMQAPPPVPRKTADSATRTRQSAKSQASADKAPTPNPEAPVNEDSANRNREKSNGIRPKDTEQAITVSKLPTVDVRRDWGIWLFNLCLVVAGGIQALLLYRTWGQIKRQADEIAGQRSVMTSQLEAAQRTVEVIEADQRARVGVTKVEISEFHPVEQSRAIMWLKNFGKSVAVNVNVDWYMEPGPERTHWYASGAHSPDVTLFPESEFPLPIETPSWISGDEFEAIRTGKLFLYVWGLVQYRVLDPNQPIYASQFSFAYNHKLKQFWACGGFWNTD
jgi:hypothetical protein